nr:TnsD family Tn7-like transposition protein [uncultured Acetatifactor sp.]
MTHKLSFFPTPYPDECLYSIFCRYYVRSGISSPTVATKRFFGCDKSLLTSTVYFPRKLERLDYWVNPDSDITGRKLICEHTAYPYHSISYVDDIYRRMEEVIRDGIPQDGIEDLIRRMIGKCKYTFTEQYLRYCPECAREDIEKYGETYWHRLPQMPGVKFCPKHRCGIKNSSVSFERMRVRIYPASYVLRDMDYRTECLESQYGEEYFSIAQETAWLLEYGRKFGGHKPISSKYRGFMKEQNYADFHGTSINRDSLRNDFVGKYGEAFIAELLPYEGDPLYWLRYLQESIGFNLRPLHHILLMRFFAGTVENFFHMEVKEELPYGNGLWPCANKLCSHYRKDAAVQTEIRKMGNEIWAWFECPYCGMRYRRSDPGQSFEEYLKKPCISDRGFIYGERLKECLSDPELSLNAIADMLGVGANTIGQYAKKNGIDVKKRRKASYYSSGADKCEGETAYYKRRVQEELEKTPVMSCRDLKERVPGAYEWLIRKEPDWIHARLIHEFDKPRWNEWGEAALAELKAAYAEIQLSGDKRKRMNISWLARVAGINRDDIYGRLRYLPEMQKFFDEVCETQEEWIRRRYTEIAIEKKEAGGKEFTYDDVKRKVQVRRGSYEKNRDYLERLIAELNDTFFIDN